MLDLPVSDCEHFIAGFPSSHPNVPETDNNVRDIAECTKQRQESEYQYDDGMCEVE